MKLLFLFATTFITFSVCAANHQAYHCHEAAVIDDIRNINYCHHLLEKAPWALAKEKADWEHIDAITIPSTCIIAVIILLGIFMVASHLIKQFQLQKCNLIKLLSYLFILCTGSSILLIVAMSYLDDTPRWNQLTIQVPLSTSEMGTMIYQDCKSGRISPIAIPPAIPSPLLAIINKDERIIKKGINKLPAPFLSDIKLYKCIKQKRNCNINNNKLIIYGKKTGSTGRSTYLKLKINSLKKLKKNEHLFLYYKQDGIFQKATIDKELYNSKCEIPFQPIACKKPHRKTFFNQIENFLDGLTTWPVFAVRISDCSRQTKGHTSNWHFTFYPVKSKVLLQVKKILPLIESYKSSQFPLTVKSKNIVYFKTDSSNYQLTKLESLDLALTYKWIIKPACLNKNSTTTIYYRHSDKGNWQSLGNLVYKAAGNLTLPELKKELNDQQLTYFYKKITYDIKCPVGNTKINHEFKIIKTGQGPELNLVTIKPTLTAEVKHD